MENEVLPSDSCSIKPSALPFQTVFPGTKTAWGLDVFDLCVLWKQILLSSRCVSLVFSCHANHLRVNQKPSASSSSSRTITETRLCWVSRKWHLFRVVFGVFLADQTNLQPGQMERRLTGLERVKPRDLNTDVFSPAQLWSQRQQIILQSCTMKSFDQNLKQLYIGIFFSLLFLMIIFFAIFPLSHEKQQQIGGEQQK